MNIGNNQILNIPNIGYAFYNIVFDNEGEPSDYEFLEVNEAFEKLTGFKNSDLAGRKLCEIAPLLNDGAEGWTEFCTKIKTDPENNEFDLFFESSGKWFRVFMNQPSPGTLSAIFVDITSAKKPAVELEAFFTLNLDLLCIADLDGNFIKINEAWSRILGYTTGYLNKKNFLDFVHPDDLDSTLEAMAKLGKGEDVINFTNRYKNKDGSYHHIEWRSHPKGNLIYAAARDITERKKSEENLLKSEELNLKLLAAIPDIVIQTDLEGVITFIHDPGLHEYAFIDFKQYVGSNMFSIIDPTYLDCAIENTRLMFEKPLGVKEYKLRFNNDYALYCEVNGDVIRDADNNPTGMVYVIRDVTAAKETEIQLRKLSRAVEQSPASVIITNLTGEIEYVNPKFIEVTGYTFEEAKGQNPRVLKSGDFPAENYKELWETITSGREWRGEFLNKRKSGELFWEAASISPIKNENGETTHFLAVKEDITQQKLAHEKIRITRDTYQGILNSVSEAIYVLDENGVFIDVNRGAEIMYGYSRNELIGMSPADVSAPELNNLESVQRNNAEVLASGVSQSFEFWGVRKNGEIFPKEVIINKGTYFGKACILATARDITERKKLDEELRNQARLRDLLMEISSGFINIPLEKVDEEINRSLEKMGLFVNADRCYIFRYDWENELCSNTYEWVGRGISCEIGNMQKVPISIMQEVAEAHKRGESTFLPDVFQLPEGPARELVESQNIKSFLTVPMMHDVQCVGFVGFDYVREHYNYAEAEIQLLRIFAQLLVNVKLRKEMVKQLVIAKEKAEESNQLKTHFMNNISHEIRTPLAGLLGFGNFMMKEDLTADEKRSYYEILEQSGARLIKTVDDIMDIALLKAGSITPKPEMVNVAFILSDVYEKLQNTTSGKNVLVNLDIPEKYENLMIKTDEVLFSKILMQLAENAEKFTSNGRIVLGFEVNRQWVKFFVKDTGTGIVSDKLDILFEPFMQEDLSNTRGYEGSGLGLAIAKGMTELLGGQIWVESEKGSGSAFYFTLPRVDGVPAEAAVAGKKQAKNTPGKKLVLIAEDDESNFMLLDTMARKSGYSTLHAWNGTEAVNMCRHFPEIAVIFMDIKMPIMNGLEATARIKAFRPDLPIIAVTAHAQTGDKYKMLDAGCDAYLAKPFKMNELIALVEKITKK